MEAVMTRNVGSADRVIRVVLGFVMIGAGLYFGSWWGAIGLIPLLTATIRWCPLYALLGISSCPVKQSSAA